MSSNLLSPVTDYAATTYNIRKNLANYVRTNNIKSVIIGISGGIDSALVAALAEPIEGLKIIGASLPIGGTNKKDEIDRADLIGSFFCDEFETIKLSSVLEEMKKYISIKRSDNAIGDYASKVHKIAIGNIKARLRMIYLYNLAYRNQGMVLSTDNLTEYLLGFWTLHGDVGDYSPIQYLWKSEVYKMSQYIADKELSKWSDRRLALVDCINAVPTDGLGITNSDLDQLGAKCYAEVDKILQKYIAGTLPVKMMNHPVIQRHKKSGFKRENPYNISRAELLRPRPTKIRY